MSCLLTQGFLTECLEGLGGAKEIFLCNWETIGNEIEFTSGLISDVPAVTLYRYTPLRNSIESTEDAVNSPENGTSFVKQTLTFKVGALDATKKTEMDLLRKAKVACFIRTANDKVFMFGELEGAYITSLKAITGASKGDFNGYEVTLDAECKKFAPYVIAYTLTPFDTIANVTVSPAY